MSIATLHDDKQKELEEKANAVVAGGYIFGNKDVEKAIEELKEAR